MTRAPILWILAPVCGSLRLASGAQAQRLTPTMPFGSGETLVELTAQLQLGGFAPTLTSRT
jgi:hypothetical protein